MTTETTVSATELPMLETPIKLRVAWRANAARRTTKDDLYILELGFRYGG